MLLVTLILITGVQCIVIYCMARTIINLNDQLRYFKQRDTVGNVNMTNRLRHQLTVLLQSPRVYLRARRILAPLELPAEELEAELEIIETLQVEPETVVLVNQ